MEGKMLLVFCLVGLALFAVDVECQGASDEYRLRSELSRRYDDIRRQMVPGEDQGLSPLTLAFGVSAIKILDFDEEKDIITLYGWHRLAWKDVNLGWGPEDYGGIDHLRLPSDLMWRPDMVLYNSLKLGSGQDEAVLTVVSSDGSILFIPPAINRVKCERLTPEDHDDADDEDDDHDDGDEEHRLEWECKFKFGSWVYSGSTVGLELYDNITAIDVTDLIPDNKYEVVSTSAKINVRYYPCCPEPYPDATFKMRIRRK